MILAQGLKLNWGRIHFQAYSCGCHAALGTPASKLLTWLLVGLRTLAVGQRHQFLGHLGFSMGLLTIWQLIYSKARYLSESPQNRSQSFYNLIWEWYPVTLLNSVPWKWVTKSSPSSRGGDYRRACIPGRGGIIVGHLIGCSVHCPLKLKTFSRILSWKESLWGKLKI